MFESMLKLVEQQLGDGAIKRKEFDLPRPTVTLPTDGRASLIQFILDATPDRHKVSTANGRQGIVYYDRRGRAVVAVLDTLDDDEINWIAMSIGPKPMGGPQVQQENIARGATEKAKSFKVAGGTMHASNIGDEPVTAWNVETTDGTKVAIIMKGGPKATGEGGKGVAEVFWPGMKKAGFRGRVMLTINGASKLKSAVPQATADELPDLVRKHRMEAIELTPKSRTIVERFVVTNLPGDRRMEVAGRTLVVVDGIAPKTDVTKVSDHDLVEVANDLGYSGEFELAEASALTGKFYRLKTQTIDEWFHPLTDLKGGTVRGLQVSIKDSGKPGKPVLKTQPWEDLRGRGGYWKEADPPSDVLAKFEAHDLYAKPSPKTERTSGGLRRSRDAMDPTVEVWWASTDDMSKDEFERLVRAKGLRGRISVEGDRYTIHSEARTTSGSNLNESASFATVSSKKRKRVVFGEVNERTADKLSIVSSLGQEYVFNPGDPDLSIQFY